MDQTINFKYFYGAEADSYTFYRFPKLLITDKTFKGLSSDAKILYGLMLDRISLSTKNGWLDADKRVYIYYSLEDVMEDLNCSKNTGMKSLQELENIGLIERRKQGQGKPALIYVKNFVPVRQVADSQNLGIKTPKICDSRLPESGNQDSQDLSPNNNKINNTNNINTESNLILSAEEKRLDVNAYMDLIKENLEIDILMENHPYDRDTLEGIFELVVETVVSQSDSIVIASSRYPTELVRSKMLKLTSSHIEYVLACFNANTTKVRNIKKYLLATLFNAPTTIGGYYTAEVHHDFPQYARAK